jgi:2'-5' RNA ligase
LRSIQLSESLNDSHPSHFVLSKSINLPHLTLYFTEIPSKNIDKVVDMISSKYKDTAIKLEFSEFFLGDDGYFDIEFEKNNSILDLHNDILRDVNQLREGHVRQKWLDEFDSYSKTMQTNLEQFGSIYVKDLYRPHITLAKFKDKVDYEEILKSFKFEKIDWSFERVAVFEAGDYGTCKMEIKK